VLISSLNRTASWRLGVVRIQRYSNAGENKRLSSSSALPNSSARLRTELHAAWRVYATPRAIGLPSVDQLTAKQYAVVADAAATRAHQDDQQSVAAQILR
jgi:hypothetical protein